MSDSYLKTVAFGLGSECRVCKGLIVFVSDLEAEAILVIVIAAQVGYGWGLDTGLGCEFDIEL